MDTLNMCKTIMVALVASYITMVFFNNVTDYSTNLSYVQHVMTMDSLPQSSSHHWRSIQLPLLHHAAYLFIIILQLLSSALCWKGFLQFLRHTNRESVISARQIASFGAGIGIWSMVWRFFRYRRGVVSCMANPLGRTIQCQPDPHRHWINADIYQLAG